MSKPWRPKNLGEWVSEYFLGTHTIEFCRAMVPRYQELFFRPEQRKEALKQIRYAAWYTSILGRIVPNTVGTLSIALSIHKEDPRYLIPLILGELMRLTATFYADERKKTHDSIYRLLVLRAQGQQWVDDTGDSGI